MKIKKTFNSTVTNNYISENGELLDSEIEIKKEVWVTDKDTFALMYSSTTCKDVLLNGLKISDKMHADYFEMCENDLEIQYFDTIEERNEFEQKINPS